MRGVLFSIAAVEVESGVSDLSVSENKVCDDCDGKMALPVSSWLSAGIRKTVMETWKDSTSSKQLALCRHQEDCDGKVGRCYFQ